MMDMITEEGNSNQCVLRIIHVNDVYKLDNLSHFASCKKINAVDANKIIGILAGDFLAPSLLSSLDSGESMVMCMNKAGIDYICIGNHESDILTKELRSRIAQSNFTWINSNMPTFKPVKEEPEKNLPEYVIVEVENGNRRVALLGLTLNYPDTLKKGSFGVSIADIESVNKTAVKLYHKLKNEVDLVIPITHQNLKDDLELAETGFFPLILAGHDHEVYINHYDYQTKTHVEHFDNIGDIEITSEEAPKVRLGLRSMSSCDLEPVPQDESPLHIPDSFKPLVWRCKNGSTVLKAGHDAILIGICDIKWKISKLEVDKDNSPMITLTLKEAKDFAPDEHVEQFVKEKKKILEELESSALVAIPSHVRLTSQGSRYRPVSVGTFLCTALRMQTKSDCALINGGTIRGNRNYAKDSYFTMAHLKEELVLPTVMVQVELPGYVLMDAIIYSRARRYGSDGGGYLHTDVGLRFDHSENIITHLGSNEKFDPQKLYTVCLPQIILNGIDDIRPLLEYIDQNPQHNLKDNDSGVEAIILIVRYFCLLAWSNIIESKIDFEDIDTDKNGFIDKDELRSILSKKGRIGFVSDTMLHKVLALADTDGTPDGKINKSEFGSLIENLKEYKELTPKVDIFDGLIAGTTTISDFPPCPVPTYAMSKEKKPKSSVVYILSSSCILICVTVVLYYIAINTSNSSCTTQNPPVS